MKVIRILFFMALCLMGFATHAEEVIYTVKLGDTLSKIALAHRTSVDTLVETNSIANRDLIHPKQKLSIVLPERRVAVSSQKQAVVSPAIVAHASLQAESVKVQSRDISSNAMLVETSLYTCTIRPSSSPHCEEKAVLGHNEQVVPASVAIPTDHLPLSVSQDVMADMRAETQMDLENIDSASATMFSVVKDLFPLSLNDTRTKRRASIRKFLRTYLGPPHDLARMEDVLLDAPFPSLSLKPTRGEFKD